MCLLSRLGRVAASDGCLLSLDSQLPLVAGQVGGGGHQRIYRPHRARHKLHIPEPNKQRGLAQSRSRPTNMTGDSSAACICWHWGQKTETNKAKLMLFYIEQRKSLPVTNTELPC